MAVGLANRAYDLWLNVQGEDVDSAVSHEMGLLSWRIHIGISISWHFMYSSTGYSILLHVQHSVQIRSLAFLSPHCTANVRYAYIHLHWMIL